MSLPSIVIVATAYAEAVALGWLLLALARNAIIRFADRARDDWS